jgi:hypothetical protein
MIGFGRGAFTAGVQHQNRISTNLKLGRIGYFEMTTIMLSADEDEIGDWLNFAGPDSTIQVTGMGEGSTVTIERLPPAGTGIDDELDIAIVDGGVFEENVARSISMGPCRLRARLDNYVAASPEAPVRVIMG